MSDQPASDTTVIVAINRLTTEVEKLNNHRFVKIQNSTWRLLLLQLGRGLAFGLGTALGASLLVSVMAWWLSQVEFVPILGEWATEILNHIDISK